MAQDGTRAAILGTGSYVPEKKLTNLDLQNMLDTTDEWITSRTGIKCRRIAAENENTSDLCLKASKLALEQAEIAAADLDLIIVATLTPDYMMPSTACVLQEKLGLATTGTAGFDMNAACSGFVYALATAKAYVESGMLNNILVCGAEVLSRFMDYEDRGTCILFGDGAGAAVVGRERSGKPSHPILSTKMWADGRGAEQIIIPAGGSVTPATRTSVDERMHKVRVQGREVFRFGVSKMVETLEHAIKTHDLKPEDIGQVVPHQANIRILDAAAERTDIPKEVFFNNLDAYGNTSGGSVPLALDEANRKGKLPAGKKVILIGFGAGLTWCYSVLEW